MGGWRKPKVAQLQVRMMCFDNPRSLDPLQTNHTLRRGPISIPAGGQLWGDDQIQDRPPTTDRLTTVPPQLISNRCLRRPYTVFPVSVNSQLR